VSFEVHLTHADEITIIATFDAERARMNAAGASEREQQLGIEPVKALVATMVHQCGPSGGIATVDASGEWTDDGLHLRLTIAAKPAIVKTHPDTSTV
jgi:hypothetical protein